MLAPRHGRMALPTKEPSLRTRPGGQLAFGQPTDESQQFQLLRVFEKKTFGHSFDFFSGCSFQVFFWATTNWDFGILVNGLVDLQTHRRDQQINTGPEAAGYGKFIHADGDIYEGDWQDDKAHGHGRWGNRTSQHFGLIFGWTKKMMFIFVSKKYIMTNYDCVVLILLMFFFLNVSVSETLRYQHVDGSTYEGEWIADRQSAIPRAGPEPTRQIVGGLLCLYNVYM